jgi:NADPH:quinone reductase-like Zn-dependent oxidoreductase
VVEILVAAHPRNGATSSRRVKTMSAGPPLALPSSTAPLDFSKQINLSSLRDQRVLVTGGANGIGAGFVAALAQAGYDRTHAA